MASVANINSEKRVYNGDTLEKTLNSKYPIIINDWAIGYIKENGEEHGDITTYTFINDNAVMLSASEFWRYLSDTLHLNFSSLFGEFLYADSGFTQLTSIYKLFKQSGVVLTPAAKDVGAVSRSVVEVSTKTQNQITVGMGGFSVSGTGVQDVAAEFYLAGKYTGSLRDRSACPVVVTYRCGRYGIFDFDVHNELNLSIVMYDSTIVNHDEHGYFIRTEQPVIPEYAKITIHIVFDGQSGSDSTISELRINGEVGNLRTLDSSIRDLDGVYINGYEEADDPYDPYAPGGTNAEGGGDGTFDDTTEKVELTPLPEIDIGRMGMFTAYRVNIGVLQGLASYLWSDLFDIDTYKKVIADPMQECLGLTIIPVEPVTGGNEEITFGGLSSGVSAPVITSQFKEVTCGSVKIDKYWGNFADYSPYTKIDIYLPFIGTRSLDPNDVMGKTISLRYRFDVITGACVAIINVSGLGDIYTFSGSGITNMPMSANDFSQGIGNFISAATAIGTTIAGAVTGVAPVTAMGAVSLAGSVSSAAATNQERVQKSGSVSGSAGLMGHRNSFVTITRPKQAVPKDLPSLAGIASSYSSILGELHGFTACELMHLENIPATDAEKREIEALLIKGVII